MCMMMRRIRINECSENVDKVDKVDKVLKHCGSLINLINLINHINPITVIIRCTIGFILETQYLFGYDYQLILTLS